MRRSGQGRTLRGLATAAALGMLALAGAGCGGSGSGAGDAGPEPVWRPAFDTSTAGSLSGVWGSGPDDVFIVGGTALTGEAWHFDGTDWSEMAVPAGTPLLVWVHGFGPDDVWAVGVLGAVLHYDGVAWQALDSGSTGELWGVFGFASDDLWIVGGSVLGGDPILIHYDGVDFTQHALEPGDNPNGAHALFKVWGIDGRIFAVGQVGLILELVGDDWMKRDAGAQANQDFISLWGTSEDALVVVGGRGNARIATLEGTVFDTLAPGAGLPAGTGGINAVFMDDPAQAIVGGVVGLAGAFDPDRGELVIEPTPTDIDLHAMWGDGAGRTYAVGGTFLPPDEGVALVRTLE